MLMKYVLRSLKGRLSMLPEAIAFINGNSGAITAVFAAVVAISAVFYAIMAWGLVSETRRMRVAQIEPKIEITLKILDFAVDIVQLHVKNIGPGPARNVKFSSAIISGGEAAESLLEEFSKADFLKTGLNYFSSGNELHSGIARIAREIETKTASVLAYDVEYESITGKKYKDRITIDMSELKSINQIGRPNLFAIARSLEAIQNDLSSISSGNRKIRTDVYTTEDRAREEAEELAIIEKFKKEKKLRGDADN
jgi:hypothetical protein